MKGEQMVKVTLFFIETQEDEAFLQKLRDICRANKGTPGPLEPYEGKINGRDFSKQMICTFEEEALAGFFIGRALAFSVPAFAE
jgi:hypothetical protein